MSPDERHANRQQIHHNYELTKQLNQFAFADGSFDRYAPQLEQLFYAFGELEKPKNIPPNLDKIFTANDFVGEENIKLTKKRLSPVADFLQEAQAHFIDRIGNIVQYHRIGVSYENITPKLSRTAIRTKGITNINGKS
jgi:hypothetical protein